MKRGSALAVTGVILVGAGIEAYRLYAAKTTAAATLASQQNEITPQAQSIAAGQNIAPDVGGAGGTLETFNYDPYTGQLLPNAALASLDATPATTGEQTDYGLELQDGGLPTQQPLVPAQDVGSVTQ